MLGAASELDMFRSGLGVCLKMDIEYCMILLQETDEQLKRNACRNATWGVAKNILTMT